MTLTRMQTSSTVTGRQTMECTTWLRAIRLPGSLVKFVFDILCVVVFLC